MRSKRLELDKLPTTKPLVDGPRVKNYRTYSVGDRYNASLSLLRSIGRQQQNHVPAIVNVRKAKEIVSDATVGDVSLEKQISSTNKQRVAFVDGPGANDAVDERLNEIGNIAVDARLNTVGLKKQRPSTTNPCSAFINGSREDEIVTDPVDGRFNALDAGNDIRDEDADALDTENDVREEDADTLDADGNSGVPVVGDQSSPTNSDEDADTIDTSNNIRDEDAEILDLCGDSDVHIAEDQSLSTDSDEDADVFDEDGNNDIQNVEGQSSPTNSEKVAGSSRKWKRDKVGSQVNDTHSESNNTKCTSQANTFSQSGFRKLIIFDKYGRPCDAGSEDFALDIGRIARSRCPPAFDDWRIVPQSMKEVVWKDVVAKYVVPEVYKPNILSRARVSWKNWKSLLRGEMDKHETIAEKKKNMPERLIRKREDWESFVDFCNTEEDKKRRAIGKKSREALEFNQSCGRRGIYRKIYDLEKESPTGEVNRSAIFLDTHVSKTINDPESSSISDIKMRLIKELVEANPDCQNDIDNDAVALVCGRDAGVVRGIGGGVSRAKLRASATVVETLRKVQQENKSLQSDIQLLIAQSVNPTQDHASTPSYQFASQAPGVARLAPDASTESDEDDILAADGNDYMQIVKEQSLHTNSSKVAGLSKKRKHDNVQREATDPHNELNNANCIGNGQGNTSLPSGIRKLIVFDKYGRPCDVGSEQFSTAIGKIVRARCPPAIDDWRIVPVSTKEDIWKNIVAKYVVPEVYKPNILSRARHSWKNWKSLLRIEMDNHETIPEKKLNMPERLIKNREDWENFVDFCNTDKDRKRRASGKKSREAMEIKQSWGRRGAYRKIYDLEKGSPIGEGNRSAIFPDTHASKTINDPESSSNSDASNLPALSSLVPDVSNLPARSSFAQPDISDMPASSPLVAPASKLPGSSCFIKNFKGRTVALGSFNTAEPPMEHVFSLIIEDIFDRDAELFDKDGKLGDITIGGVINWPKACVESNLPVDSCFIRNFKRKTIAFGSFSTAADPQMEHVYCVIVKEIYDRDAELFDTDGKLGDIMIGGVINWPKACVKPC